MLLIREINDLRSALIAAKNNLQMERATMATASLGASAMNQEKTHGSRTLAAALEAVGGDPDVLIARQRVEIEELRRAVKALEDKLAISSTGSRSGEVFPLLVVPWTVRCCICRAWIEWRRLNCVFRFSLQRHVRINPFYPYRHRMS